MYVVLQPIEGLFIKKLQGQSSKTLKSIGCRQSTLVKHLCLMLYRVDESSQTIRNQETSPQSDQLRNELKDFDDLADAVTPLWRVSLLIRISDGK